MLAAAAGPRRPAPGLPICAGSSQQAAPLGARPLTGARATQDLSYTVWNSANKKQKIKLLTEVSGFMPPGHLSALMGPSGSSKTTLLGARARQPPLPPLPCRGCGPAGRGAAPARACVACAAARASAAGLCRAVLAR